MRVRVADLEQATVACRAKFDRAFLGILVERLNLANSRLGVWLEDSASKDRRPRPRWMACKRSAPWCAYPASSTTARTSSFSSNST